MYEIAAKKRGRSNRKMSHEPLRRVGYFGNISATISFRVRKEVVTIPGKN